MFTFGGPEAEAAILSGERRIDISVLVDWDGDGNFAHPLSDLSQFVSSAVTDRALRGSAPDEILFVSGASAAELTLIIGGEYEGLPMTAVMSPYNGFSPFYLQDVVGPEIVYRVGIETALGWVWYPQFRGNISTVTPNRGENSVEIVCLDRVEKLRKPVQIVPWAMSEEHVIANEMESQLVHSQWVIDNCLRLCDVSQTPHRPMFKEEMEDPFTPGQFAIQQFWLSGNGSYLPTVGYVDNPNASSFPAPPTQLTVREGPTHPELPPGIVKPWALNGLGMPIGQVNGDPSYQGIIRYWAQDRNQISHIGSHWCGFTLNLYDNAWETIAAHNALEIRIGKHYELRVQVDAGYIRSGLFHMEGGSTEPAVWSEYVQIPDEPHVDVMVYWLNKSDGQYCYLKVGSNSNSGVTEYGDGAITTTDDQITGRVTIGHALSMSDVFYATWESEFGAGVPETVGIKPAKYTGVMDQGLNRFTYMPSVEYREAWDWITEVAAAENGSVLWDEEGRFQFMNLNEVLNKQVNSVRTLTLDDLIGLQITNTLDTVRNVYSVTVARKRAIFQGRIFEGQDVNEFYIGNPVVKDIRIWQDNIVSPLTFFMQRHSTLPGSPYPEWNDEVGHGYVLQYKIGGVWQEDDTKPDLTRVSLYFTDEGYLTLNVVNLGISGYEVRLAANNGTVGDGDCAVRAAGTAILEYDEVPVVTKDRDSATKYGERTLALSGDWYQDQFAQSLIQSMLLARTAKPAPVTDAIVISGDPRLQLGDTVQVLDPDGFGENFKLQIYGINRKFSREEGLVDTLTVELIAAPGVGIWDSEQYGRWDETFVWS